MSLRKGQNKDVIIGSKKVRYPARDVLTVFLFFQYFASRNRNDFPRDRLFADTQCFFKRSRHFAATKHFHYRNSHASNRMQRKDLCMLGTGIALIQFRTADQRNHPLHQILMKTGIGNCCPEIKKPFPEYKKVNIKRSAFPKINFTCCRPPKQSRIKKQKRQTSVFLSHVPVFLPVYSRNAPAYKRYSASAAFAACGECVTMITHRFSL